MPLALLALAIGAFAIGSTEFLMMGLLPEVSAAFQVSVPTAGQLISGYALGVVVGALLLTAAAAHLSRKIVLLGLMAVFTAGNLLAAVAPSYEMLLAARVLTGLPHEPVQDGWLSRRVMSEALRELEEVATARRWRV